MAESSANLVPVWKVITEPGASRGAILLMRDGTFRMILRVGAVNFDMKSQSEQASITRGFGAFLNSLSPEFPIQIQVHTKNLDAEGYISQFNARLKSPNVKPHIKALIEDHCNHFRSQASSSNLLQREFYIIVPYGIEDTEVQKSTDSLPGMSLLKALLTPKDEGVEPKMDDLELDVARQQLDLRASQVEAYMGRMEIPARRLGEQDVRELLHEFFNPDVARSHRLRSSGPTPFVATAPRLEGGPTHQQRRARSAEPVEQPALEPARPRLPAHTAPEPIPLEPRPTAPTATPTPAAAPPPTPTPTPSDRRRRGTPTAPTEVPPRRAPAQETSLPVPNADPSSQRRGRRPQPAMPPGAPMDDTPPRIG